MTQILIGHSRAGTSWLSDHFSKVYGRHWWDEYFTHMKKRVLTDPKPNRVLTPEERDLAFHEGKKLLDDDQSKGQEYFIKYHVSMITRLDRLYPNWWDQFYKDYEKIYLYNRNVWRIFLSRTCQENVEEASKSLWKKTDSMLKPFSVDVKSISRFALQYKNYVMFDRYDTFWDYDTLTDQYIAEYIGGEPKPKVVPTRYDYAAYLQHLDLVKETLYIELESMLPKKQFDDLEWSDTTQKGRI